MGTANVWAVMKDPGEVAAILPITDELRRSGCDIRLFASGWAAKNGVGGRPYTEAETAVIDAAHSFHIPHMLLTGMSSGGGPGRDLISKLHGKSITVLVQDLWGMEPSYRRREFQPDYVITNDEIGKKILCDSWPDLDPKHVFTTGFVALDTYATMDSAGRGKRVREALDLKKNLPLVLFAGQGLMTAFALAEVVHVLNLIDADFYFIPHPHPRMLDDYGTEVWLWKKALAQFRGRLVVDRFPCTSEQLIAAAAANGVVISMYSTMLLEAGALRAQAISVLYPETGMKAMFAETGQRQFPLIDLDCVKWAKDRRSLHKHVRAALTGSLRLEQAQRRHISVDGQNARRAAEALRRLLA